jgi:hypothetical protein
VLHDEHSNVSDSASTAEQFSLARDSSTISRRQAICSGLVAATGIAFTTGAPKWAHGDNPASIPNRDGIQFAHRISEEMWANLLGEKFYVNGLSFQNKSKKRVKGELILLETKTIEFKNDSRRLKTLRPNASSLVFESLRGGILESASYVFEHQWLGRFDLLISPTHLEKFNQQIVFEAMIN